MMWVLALMAVGSPTDSVQSNWKLIGRGKDGSTFHADLSTSEKLEHNQVRVWTRVSQVPRSRYDHEKIQITFDCEKHSSRYDAAISYRADGTIAKDNYKPDSKFLPVIPNSVDWQTMNLVCGLQAPA